MSGSRIACVATIVLGVILAADSARTCDEASRTLGSRTRPLAKRGRPGHEKPARIDYLIEEREVHLTLTRAPSILAEIDRLVPSCWVRLDRFYFRYVDDQPRRQAITARLQGGR